MFGIDKSSLLSRAFPLWIMLLLTAGSVNTARADSNCLAVHGVSFEKVSFNKLLAVREGRNIGFVTVTRTLPENLGAFRFFSPNLCEYGAEDKFTINGKLYEVSSSGIQLFR
jgi:hypothetical protein